MKIPGRMSFQLILQAALMATILAGCSGSPTLSPDSSDGAPPRKLNPEEIEDAIPRAEPMSRYGNPESYRVLGRRYRVMGSSRGYSERGIASWYGTKFHGRRTSSGEPYDMYSMTAAHKSLPLPTYVRVTNLRNGRSVVVKVNDRGPFHGNRIIDLSYAAATKLEILGEGTGLVEVAAIDPRRPVPPPAAPTPVADPRVRTIAGEEAGATPAMFIQIGAFSSRANADRLRQRLETSLGQPIRVSKSSLSGEALFRVQVGPLTDVAQSDQISRELAQQGLNQLHIVIE